MARKQKIEAAAYNAKMNAQSALEHGYIDTLTKHLGTTLESIDAGECPSLSPSDLVRQAKQNAFLEIDENPANTAIRPEVATEVTRAFSHEVFEIRHQREMDAMPDPEPETPSMSM